MSIPSHNELLHFLSLPAEIRFMIYREVSPVIVQSDSKDVQDVDWYNDINFDSDDEEESTLIDKQFEHINQHFEAVVSLQNLFNTCAQIRDELISELTLTQLHLRNDYPPFHAYFGGRVSHYTFFKKLWSSALFTKHVRHVSLHWGNCFRAQGRQFHHALDCNKILDWLGACEQLKTLELVIPDLQYSATEDLTKKWVRGMGMVPRTEDERWQEMWHDPNLFCEACRRRLPDVLGKLEKVVGRPWLPDDGLDIAVRRYSIVARGDGEWATKKWFQRVGDTAGLEEEEEGDLEGDKTTDVVVKKHASKYKFKHNFGAADVVWPLLDSV